MVGIMRSTMTALLFLLLACSAALAQGKDCPEISVTGPAGIPQPGDEMPYSVDVGESGKANDLKYFWSTSSGEIVSGQGTTSVRINYPGFDTLTVTVRVTGLPEGCATTFSESASWGCILPVPEKLGIVRPKLSQNDESIATKLKEALNPGDQVYIIHRSLPATSARLLAERERGIVITMMQAVPELSGDRSRITIVRAKGKVNLFEIWRVPPGADNPNP